MDAPEVPPPPPPRPTAAPRAVAARRRRWPWLLALLVLALPLLAAVLLWSAWRSLHTEAGTQWWLGQVANRLPGITLTAPRGALLGAESEFALERATLRLGRSTLEIEQLSARGLVLGGWRWQAPYAQLQARALAARRVEIALGAPTTPPEPAVAPRELRLPLVVRLDALRIERLQLPGVAQPIETLAARLEAGDTHRIEELRARWNGLQLDGRAQIEAAAPLLLQARVALRADDQAPSPALPGWARGLALSLQAGGPLARFDAQAALTMQDQRLDASAQVTPFDALPVSQLDARFAQLDLARLLAPLVADASTPLPTTALSGSAALQLNREQPLALRLQLRNEQPGRWDAQRLPLREVDLLARGSGSSWQIERARLQLASDARSPAGVLSGSGRFDAAAGSVRLLLEDLQLDRLDRRAPPLRLSGPIELQHTPAPPGVTPAPPFGRLDFNAQFTGVLQGVQRERAARPLRGTVQVTARGRATPDTLTLDALSARAGAARLDGTARAQRGADAWDTRAALKLADFDPALWLPGEPGAAWRRQRNALNGSVTLDARIPAAAADAAALLAALRGSIKAELADSAFAGQPLGLSLQAQADGRGRLSAQGQATAAGNSAQLALALRAPAAGRAADGADAQQLQLQLDAPALSRLAPLAEAFGLGPLAGRALLDARADGDLGAWLLGGRALQPLATRGSLQLDELRVGNLELLKAGAAWDATLPAGDAPAAALARTALKGRLDATQLRMPGLLVPQLALQADGTLAEHRANLQATLRQPPPPGAEARGEPAPLALDAQLAGTWRAGDGSAPARWSLRLPELALRPTAAPANANTGAAAAPTPPPLPLVVARDLALELQHGDGLLRVQLAPGAADVLGAVLRWSVARWERRDGAPAQLELQAEVEPFVVSQLLARLQPDFGWGGDLRVGARASIRSGPAVQARVEIARTGGDLQISEFGSVQPLRLTDARLEFSADAGLWRMTQLVAGANLGRIEGQQTLRTRPELLWPAPEASVEGRLQVQVENLGNWGVWVPAGWRLGGQLDGAVRIAGRLGAPELIGEAHGRRLALRHSIEGVTLTDGELDARFDGSTARLETLRFKAGDGSISAQGDARLGAAPQATLEVVAERAALLSRVDRRVVVSGRAAARLAAQKVAVNGELTVDEGLVDISRADAPSLGDDVSVRRAGDAPSEAESAAAARRTPRAIDLKLGVNVGNRFRLRGRGIDTRLEGDLRLTTPNGRLAAHGEIRTVEGTYEAYGQKLEIARGVITFVGSIDNPRLDIEAVRANTDVRVGVTVGGSVLTPRVRLFSDPELPATEKLALLVTGRSYDSLAGGETLLMQRAALALLAGDGSEGSNLDIARMFQLDELSVRQSDGAVRDTVVTLGKQISDRVYVGYERGLNATAGNWQLIYRIAQRFTLRAQSGEDSALDLIWLFRWN